MADQTGRREFLRRVIATGAGAYSFGRFSRPAHGDQKPSPDSPSKVVIVRSSALGPFDGRPQPDQSVLTEMLGRGMTALTGESSVMKAWGKVFKPDDRVSIKVNGLGGPRASTRPELANSVAASVQMAGVAPDDIIIWDRRDRDLEEVGFALNRNQPGVKCYGTEGEYTDEIEHRSFRGRISRILSDRTTALINLPILKDHNSAGVTVALKNHYGTCNNPGAHHGNHCDPYLADLNDVPEIRDKTRLIVCDAVQAVCEGGPGFRSPECLWEPQAIMLGFDPVALDFVGWQIIEQRRRDIGLPSLADAGREPKWIATAESLGLGHAREDKIEVIRIET
ncbi:MAG: DUF362 domain-containing protein [Armatimonadota bacterium]|nr:MAG: DUF362 domain-containing protein [Armatimonadota bacterium]